MASTVNDGQRVPDREIRNALTTAAAEITALSGIVATQATQITALSGHVGTGVATLAIATDTLTAVMNNLRDLKVSLIAAGLLGSA